MRADGGVKISAAAYVKAKAETYLPKPLEKYPLYDTPSTPQLVKDTRSRREKNTTWTRPSRRTTNRRWGL
eukprot:1045872-Pleurochrysis_carterae.AAC.1